MRGENHCRPVRCDEPGSADTNSGDVFGPGELHQLGDDLDDRPLDNRWALGSVRGVPTRAMGDVAIHVDHTAGHLRATAVDSDGKSGGQTWAPAVRPGWGTVFGVPRLLMRRPEQQGRQRRSYRRHCQGWPWRTEPPAGVRGPSGCLLYTSP